MMINAIFSRKGKIAFQVLIIVLYQWSTINDQSNLYDIDKRFQSNAFQFDCLNYQIRRETVAHELLSDAVEELMPFCFRPESNLHESLNDFDDSFSEQLSFEELRRADITVQQLLSWSISMEKVERYQFYLDISDSVLNEYIYNCTPPRFGLRCQYSFEFGNQLSFNEIVEADFRGREAYSASSDLMVEVPCYVLLECHRNGQPWCLDDEQRRCRRSHSLENSICPFQCSNQKECIQVSQLCDKKTDCSDGGDDESEHLCKNQHPTCAPKLTTQP